MHCCHLKTCTTKKSECVVLCSKGGKIREKPVSRIPPLKGGDDMFDTKTFNLADVSSFSPYVINFVDANIRERVYFEQQILALLLVHQTHNLSRINFAHISRQVEGWCIS